MKLKPLTYSIGLAVFLQGCSLAPVYERPAMPVSGAWPTGDAYQTAALAEGQADIGWDAFFKDPALKRLIKLSLENNRDLRIAMLNVDAFRAQYRIQRSELFPTLDAGADGIRQRVPADLSPTGEAGVSSQYTAGVSTAYELDFFGRIRNLNRQALEEFLATAEAQRIAHISLVASVADAYLAWQADRSLLDLTRRTLKTYEQTLSLVQSSYDAGVASALDVRQARTAVDEARAQLQRYNRRVANDENALRLLVGGPLPADLPAGLDIHGDVLADVPVGLPSDLLQRRPDIRAAEHRLVGANANIGAARAAFFPRISLTGSAGTASADMSGLFEGGSGMWSFMPRITIPIFNAGRLRASLDYSEVQQDIRVAQYEQAIQTAFKEVSDGLAARGTYDKQLAAQRELVQNTNEYFELAQQRYQEGIDSYLNVLDAQRLLFTSQQQLITDRLAQLGSEIALYKALGGGWLEKTDTASAPAF